VGRKRILNLVLSTSDGYTNSIPLQVDENETIGNAIVRLVNDSRLPEDIRARIRGAIQQTERGERGYVISVVDGSGTLRIVPPDERVGRVIDTYGTNQLNLEIENIVGIEICL